MEALAQALHRLGLLADPSALRAERLAGGVSSDIWRIDLPTKSVCVKRALPKLRVAQDWYAPVERNAFELAWISVVGDIVPDAVPRILAHDADAGLFVMDYLPPADYPVWKTLLRDGVIDTVNAHAVAERLVRIHSATANNDAIAQRFASDHIFFPIRLQPYLQAAAKLHPELDAALQRLVDTTASTKRALAHGDVSPKNILIGPKGPVFLDAECAWYGDPAFDLAFCLNHLLLKCLWRPQWTSDYLACFTSLAECYLAAVDWEDQKEIECRTAQLLPGLLLARVDGKSPVEYLTEEIDKRLVRRVSRLLLLEPAEELTTVRNAWRRELAVD